MADVAIELGLRERKKQRTRQLIADTARDLFAEHGFEQVTVAEIARAADVAQATVFNYFPTKEDLFYNRLEAFQDQLLEAIGGRTPGQSVIDAFAAFLLGPGGVLRLRFDTGGDDKSASAQILTITRIVTGSPALLAREREVFDQYAAALSGLLADEAGSKADDVVPRVVASALLGLHRALIDQVRRKALAGTPDARIRREVHASAERAIEQLKVGLASVGTGR